MLVTDIMADVITSGMVKKKRIGQSAAKLLGDKKKVQRLEKVISLRRNLHECQNKAFVPF